MVRRLEMAGRKQSTIEDRIKKAETVLVKAKERYDAALEKPQPAGKEKERDGEQGAHAGI